MMRGPVRHVIAMLGLLLLTAVPADAGYKEGIRAARVQDFSKALSEFAPLVDQGHSGAQFNLGVMYLHGRGVKRDVEKALELFRLAAEQEHPGAMNNIGRLHVEGTGVKQDFALAVRWFRMAAKNHILARNNLAQMYLTGRGVEKSYKKALFWLKQAAKKGHAKSQYEIGIMYDHGLGVEKDSEEALRWIQKAAETDYHKALAWLREQDREKRTAARKRRAASVTYHCPAVPEVSWWGDLTHADIINEVSRKHLRKWSAYLAKWERHLNRIQQIRRDGEGIKMRKSAVDLAMGEIREKGAVGEKTVTLGGRDLDRYIVNVKKRITVHHCLALEMAARQKKAPTE